MAPHAMCFVLGTMLVCLASAAAPAPSRSTAPEQIHLALAGRNPSGTATCMSVSWQTQSKAASSTVQFGLAPTALSGMARGRSSSYFATFDHHAIIGGIAPSTRYYYRVRQRIVCAREKEEGKRKMETRALETQRGDTTRHRQRRK